MVTCRRVASEDRRYFRQALEYQQLFYTSEMPFIDLRLSDGIIKLLESHLHKIKSREDMLHIDPGLGGLILEDIMSIVQDLFDVNC